MRTVSRWAYHQPGGGLRWYSEGTKRKPFDRTPLAQVREIPGQTYGPSLLNTKPPPAAPLLSMAGVKERLTESYQALEAHLQGVTDRSFEKVNASENDKPEFANYRTQHTLRSSTRSRMLDGYIQGLILGGFAGLAGLVWAVKRRYARPPPPPERYSDY